MKIKPNKEQQKAVNHSSGPLLVVAGAGTGKTRVIVDRIAKLIDDGADKSEILALTFTEKASQEMLDRVGRKLGDSYGVEIPIHTFNAFGQLLIHEFAVEIGLSNNQKLVGEEGRVVFLREHLDALELDYFAPSSKPDGQLSTLADYFSQAKQQLITPEKYATYAEGMPTNDAAEKLEKKKHIELARAYDHYIRLMRENNVIDYDDQIFLAIHILEQRPNILKRLQNRYKHIMVDEFQDTNPLQSRLIDLLYGDVDPLERSLVVVGDDDQSIYEWRGATLANILEFTKRYPNAKKVALIENYRTTQEILDSAWQLIQHNNPDRLEVIEKLNKKLIADRGTGSAPTVYEFESRQLELSWVADDVSKRIAAAKKQSKHPSIAVLARSKNMARDMHDMLRIYDVDHVVAGLNEELYQQPIVTMMLDALAAVWQPQTADAALYHTLVGRLFSCDPVVIAGLAHDARSRRIPLMTILKTQGDEKITSVVAQINGWHSRVGETSVRALSYQMLDECGLKGTLYASATSDAQAERDVLSLSQWFKSLQDFERISTTPSVYSYLENLDVLKAEGETLDDTLEILDDIPVVMTMHKSKGLEWDVVYIVGCNQGSFPYLGGGSSLKLPEELRVTSEADSRLAEERRLMYVAATRAKDELFITHARTVTGGKTVRKPSPFIEELRLTPAENTAGEVSTDLEQHTGKHELATVGLPRKFIDGDNIVLSASQAEDYLQCPLNFYYKHVLGVPDISGPETDVGSLFHNVLQQINDAKKDGNTLPDKKSLLTRIEKEWPARGYATQKQRQDKLSHALEVFNSLYDRLIAEPVPIAVEEPFRVRIPNSHCVLHGRIDAVVPFGDGIEIHDYKTSTSVRDEKKAKSKVSASDQLTMYALAWRLKNDEKPDTVALDFILTGHIGRMKKMDKSLDTMEKKLAEAANNIKQGNFPLGAKHDYCIHP